MLGLDKERRVAVSCISGVPLLVSHGFVAPRNKCARTTVRHFERKTSVDFGEAYEVVSEFRSKR